MTLQERKKTEALERLSQLEKLYGLNPKVRKYFAEGKLYYSYITGGVIGSIDTITLTRGMPTSRKRFRNSMGFWYTMPLNTMTRFRCCV